jgi:hypothetical protein
MCTPCAGYGGGGVKAQACVHFGGHAAGDDGQDLAAEAHQQPVHDFVERAATELVHRVLEQGRIVSLLHRLEDERGIGGGVLRLERVKLLEIASVCHHGGELLEGLELVKCCVHVV